MSDERLRELERRWRETGDIEDEGRVLLERVRTGTLDASRLKMAADCGYPAACAALGQEPSVRGWRDVRKILRNAGRVPAIRAAAKAAKLALAACPNALPSPLGEMADAALQEWQDVTAATCDAARVDLGIDLLSLAWARAPALDQAAAGAVAAANGVARGGAQFFNGAAMAMRQAVKAGVLEESINREVLETLISWALEAPTGQGRA